MVRVILFFFLSIIIFLPFLDIEISLSFGDELKQFFSGLFLLNIESPRQLLIAVCNTIAIGVMGIVFSFIMGIAWISCWRIKLLRIFLSYIRAVHELFWILLFIPFLGLTPFCGVMGIAVPYSAMFARMISSLLMEKESDFKLAFSKTSFWHFIYIQLPMIYPSLKEFIRFRLECALRATALMGFIGLPTLGFYLETSFSEGLYGQVWVLLATFLIVSHYSSFYLKFRVLLPVLLLSCLFIGSDFFFSWDNLMRMAKIALVPWPVKQFFSENPDFNTVYLVLKWFVAFFNEKIIYGVYTTIILTQLSLGLCFFLSILITPLASRWFFSKPLYFLTRLKLFLSRNIPEYIIATIFLFLLGPSMLPAVLALTIHNMGIISHLSALEIDRINLSSISVNRKVDKFLYIAFPKIISKLTIYSCFRWEFFIREASILGFLGVKTLGFFADSAYQENKYDDLVLILFVMANLNLLVTQIGQRLQKMQSA